MYHHVMLEVLLLKWDSKKFTRHNIHVHRRRFSEMIVGTRFLLPFSPPLFRPSSPSLLRPFFVFSVLLPQLSMVHPSCVFPFLLRLSLSPLLNPAIGGLGERCKLPQRVPAEPGRQTVHFQAEVCVTFVTGLMINSYFYCTFTLSTRPSMTE